MSDLIRVPFHGADILCMQNTRGEWVVTRPLCERLGVDARGQQQRIQRSAWGKQGSCMMHAPSAGGMQQTFCLHRSRIAMWLATIDTSRIKDEAARSFLELLQVEAADVLDAYFNKRSAPPPAPVEGDPTYALLQRINAGVATDLADIIETQRRQGHATAVGATRQAERMNLLRVEQLRQRDLLEVIAAALGELRTDLVLQRRELGELRQRVTDGFSAAKANPAGNPDRGRLEILECLVGRSEILATLGLIRDRLGEREPALKRLGNAAMARHLSISVRKWRERYRTDPELRKLALDTGRSREQLRWDPAQVMTYLERAAARGRRA